VRLSQLWVGRGGTGARWTRPRPEILYSTVVDRWTLPCSSFAGDKENPAHPLEGTVSQEQWYIKRKQIIRIYSMDHPILYS
jgi:hypothetical protein